MDDRVCDENVWMGDGTPDREVAGPDLLREVTFQLTVTRAMLKTVELDQILYIILSGITHGDGLNFNRAVLMLAWDRRNELRVSRSAGPADGEEAHRIWEGIRTERLNLEKLFDRYNVSAGDKQYLTTRLLGFSFKLDAAVPMTRPEPGAVVRLADIVSHCVATGQPVLINGNDIEYVEAGTDDSQVVFKNFACVPIFLNGVVFGLILADNFFNRRSVHPDELRGLSGVANLASIALERAMLYRRLKEMAQVDGLTGVFNRGYYERYLHDEFIRSRRLNRPVAMIVFDIDWFKRCNDLHGHECGDRVLKQFAQLLKSNTRESDLVARYGGEEFVVLLSGEVTGGGALAAAEKLRAAVEAAAFADFPPGAITVSAGVGIVMPDGDFDQLFSYADKALYDAKRGGRNCVRLYGAR